jgi:hypothetical protein
MIGSVTGFWVGPNDFFRTGNKKADANWEWVENVILG